MTGTNTQRGDVRGYLSDVLGIAGACLVSYGAWTIYAPAGFNVAGLLLIALAVLGARA